MYLTRVSSFIASLAQVFCHDQETNNLNYQEDVRNLQTQVPLAPTATTPLKLTIIPTNVNTDVIKDAVRAARQAGQVQDVLNGTRHRLLEVTNLHSWAGADKRDQNGFTAAFADYTNGRTVYVDSADAFGTPSSISVVESNEQPLPSSEEVAEAAAIAGFGTDALAYATMPPVIENRLANGTSYRIINIMVRAANSTSGGMFRYHVNMNKRTAVRIPPTAHIQGPSPPAWCRVLKKGSNLTETQQGAGAASVVISKGNEILWDLTVVRPTASSGKRGSGIDIRNVKYKGKKVLGQGHLPILNVLYKDNGTGCGPEFRDWQNWEYPFECEGTNVPGTDYLRICNKSPKTIVDVIGDVANPNKEEEGNFKGIAFYATDDAVLIRTQLIAGWYRYTSEWTLCANGTIKPRWGFGGVYDTDNNCVCLQHHHHAYFRFDFDIETPYGNSVHGYNDPALPDQSGRKWHEFLHAAHSPRTSGSNKEWQKQAWRISNQRTGNAYLVRPGPTDANTDPVDTYGLDGVWVVKHDPNFLEDGKDELGRNTKADMDNIMKGSAGRDSTIPGKDVVIWYAAHFMHDEKRESTISDGHKHLFGPDLIPDTWK